MSVKFLKGAKYFNLGELIELGRRLTENQLKKMTLLKSVIQAEQEYFWRLKSIADLSRDFSGQISLEIEKESQLAEKFAFNPQRKSSPYVGRKNFSRYRSLPEPGTLIIQKHHYQYPGPERISKNGSKHRVQSETFRFVVVDTPSTLLRLGDSQQVIYLSVSNAASAATGKSENGWRFFRL